MSPLRKCEGCGNIEPTTEFRSEFESSLCKYCYKELNGFNWSGLNARIKDLENRVKELEEKKETCTQ